MSVVPGIGSTAGATVLISGMAGASVTEAGFVPQAATTRNKTTPNMFFIFITLSIPINSAAITK
jgi:hypothetical protein